MTDAVSDIPPLPLGLRAYRIATGLARPLAEYVLAERLKKGKEDPDRIAERKGAASAERPAEPLVWIHGASVGESLSVLPLVDRLSELRPDLRFLVTTGTITSAQLMADRLPPQAQHQFAPVDHPGYVTSFLNHWRPDLALFVESEFWPNLILQTHERGAPMALVNGRISPRTYERWRKRSGAINRLLTAFDRLIAQDKVNMDRLSELSGAKAQTFGNLKMAAPPLPVDEAALGGLREMIGDRTVWLAASTHPGEEDILALAHKKLKADFPDLLTILVPRHPGRGEEVAELVSAHGLSAPRRSKGADIAPESDIYLADTLGELGLFYRLCDTVLVGGSLAPKGGHNPLEPARLYSAILHGPHTFNFSENYRDMRKAGGAALVRNEDDLAASARRLFIDGKTRDAMATAAMKTAEASAERVLADVVDAIDPLLPAKKAVS